MSDDTAEKDARCLYSWPDPNSVRVHVCGRVGAHDEHRCAACGVRVIPPSVTGAQS